MYFSISLNILQLILYFLKKNNIMSKVEVWNKNSQSLVYSASSMKEDIKNNPKILASELISGLKAIGGFANSMHEGMKEVIEQKFRICF